MIDREGAEKYLAPVLGDVALEAPRVVQYLDQGRVPARHDIEEAAIFEEAETERVIDEIERVRDPMGLVVEHPEAEFECLALEVVTCRRPRRRQAHGTSLTARLKAWEPRFASDVSRLKRFSSGVSSAVVRLMER